MNPLEWLLLYAWERLDGQSRVTMANLKALASVYAAETVALPTGWHKSFVWVTHE